MDSLSEKRVKSCDDFTDFFLESLIPFWDDYTLVKTLKAFKPIQIQTQIDNKKQKLLVFNNVLILCLAYNVKCVPGKTGCPEKWIRFGSSCYFLSEESKSWDEAREFCRARGAYLVVINTKEENQNIWIGLTDRDLEGTWKWVDGSSLTLQFWGSDQPDNHKGGEDCGHMLAYNGLWNDVTCSFTMQWICEKEERLFV
uniref:C-type lectin domain-containing protein n=1 Tax=Oryzias sinensis TaxID=183150 RepID=A0A8C7YLL6_9TELE